MEQILQELIALSYARRDNPDEQYVKSVLHPSEEALQQKTPGFYVLWAEEYKLYALVPVNG